MAKLLIRKRLAVVGARDFANLGLVRMYIEKLPPETVIVSGGARGVDRVAVSVARKLGMQYVEHLPKPVDDSYREVYKALLERNTWIVEDSDLVWAFTDWRTGGTWDTITKAIDMEKVVYRFFSGGEYVKLSDARPTGRARPPRGSQR